MEQRQTYFSCEHGLLDPYTLEYRWFGAAWRFEGDTQYIVGFWFGSKGEDVVWSARRELGPHFKIIKASQQVHHLYDQIRKRQKELDWKQRTRLSLKKGTHLSVRTLPRGYYVIRSRNQYPYYVATVQKKRFSLWQLHADIVECEQDLIAYLQKVNEEHGMTLQKVQWDHPQDFATYR